MLTKRRRSQKQEKSVAKQFDARLTPASGAKWGAKGDVRSDNFLIECKTTEKDTFILTAKTWEKIEREALRDHMRIPLLIIDLEDKDRVVVFKPKDFNDNLPEPYECSQQGAIKKSKRISIRELEEDSEYCEEYVYGKLFIICEKKNTMLFYMRMKDFKEYYKEEMSWL